MDLDQANQAAETIINRAPGAAEGNVERLQARRAQVVGVLQDLIPGGELWRLMARLPEDEGPRLLDWSLAVLGEAALYRVLLAEANDEHRDLRVRVRRVPFDLITVVSVTDTR